MSYKGEYYRIIYYRIIRFMNILFLQVLENVSFSSNFKKFFQKYSDQEEKSNSAIFHFQYDNHVNFYPLKPFLKCSVNFPQEHARKSSINV